MQVFWILFTLKQIIADIDVQHILTDKHVPKKSRYFKTSTQIPNTMCKTPLYLFKHAGQE